MDYTKHFKKCERIGKDTCPECGEELDMQCSEGLKREEGEVAVFSSTCCNYDWTIICRFTKGMYKFVSMA